MKRKKKRNFRRKKTPHCGVFLKSGRRERIRTSDPLVPNQLRYQAALLADNSLNYQEFVLLNDLSHFTTHRFTNSRLVVVRREGLEPSRP